MSKKECRKYSCISVKARLMFDAMATETEKLITKIKTALAVHGLSRTAFCYAAMGDSAFLTKLEQGREARPVTRQKVLDYINKLNAEVAE